MSPIPGFAGTLTTHPHPSWSRASGPYRATPSAVATPGSVEDVQALVRWARDQGRSIVPRGAGTGMPGGNVGSGVLVDTATAFRGITELDPERRTITVGAGVTARDVDRAAARHGLTFPVLPSSAEWCTVGGMVANNAAGALSFGYGATAEWVEGLRVVDAEGELHPLQRATGGDRWTAAAHRLGEPGEWPQVRKNSSGYALDRFAQSGDAIDLLVGSEGTLAIVTHATLRLTPRPGRRWVAAVGVANTEELVAWRSWAEETGWAACEFMGPWLVARMGLDSDPELGRLVRGRDWLLLLEWRGAPGSIDTVRRTLEDRAGHASTPWVGASDEAADELWHLRHRASPSIQAAAAQGFRSMQFIEDCVVPTGALGTYLRELQAILNEVDMEAAMFGHAGDGHVHVNPLVPTHRVGWRDQVLDVLLRTASLVADLGGTLSGEHGDGRLRAPLLSTVWSADNVGRFERLKAELDPRGTLNPGVILPLPGQRPLDTLFDPTRPDESLVPNRSAIPV